MVLYMALEEGLQQSFHMSRHDYGALWRIITKECKIPALCAAQAVIGAIQATEVIVNQ